MEQGEASRVSGDVQIALTGSRKKNMADIWKPQDIHLSICGIEGLRYAQTVTHPESESFNTYCFKQLELCR
jgi:hypothetical protein